MNYARQDGLLNSQPSGSTCPIPTPAAALLLLHSYRSRFAACSHSPHRVETSRVEVPAKFMNEAGLAVQQVPAQALPAEWWTAYGDPLIDALVRNALEHNTDLAIARARIDEAVAITRRTRASMFLAWRSRPKQRARATFLWHRPSAAMPGFRCRLHGKLI